MVLANDQSNEVGGVEEDGSGCDSALARRRALLIPVQASLGLEQASQSVEPLASVRPAKPPQLPRNRRLLMITPIAIPANAIAKIARVIKKTVIFYSESERLVNAAD
jgi:hypothetical protein